MYQLVKLFNKILRSGNDTVIPDGNLINTNKLLKSHSKYILYILILMLIDYVLKLGLLPISEPWFLNLPSPHNLISLI